MGTDALKNTLKELHSKLESGQAPDPELMQLLQTLDADIHALLAKQAGAGAATTVAADDSAGLADRARAISAGFATQHPHLEPVLRELTDMLARIGI
jgi:hypothetical protein